MSKPKVLFFDIETSPNLAYVWGKWEQDVIAFESEWQIMSIAWKWQGAAKVHCMTASVEVSDEAVCKKLHELLSEADVVIAHNGDEFDLKKARARFVVHGFKPLKPLATVDTLKVAKKYFKFNSNKLDDLGKTLGVGRKVKHSGFDMWLGCLKGNSKSWAKMAHYNKQDVKLLERVYLKLKPWMERHPNLAALQDKKGCPGCGSKNVVKWGLRPTANGVQQRNLCKGCGAYHMTRRVK